MAASGDTTALDISTPNNVRQMIYCIADSNHSTKELDFVRGNKPEDLIVEQIGSEGYMNAVWKISSPNQHNDRLEVVLKQSFSYIKSLGRSHPAPQGRSLIEYSALKKIRSICADNVVTPYCYSAEQHAFVMECMSAYETLDTRLITGKVDKVSIDCLAKALGMIHKNTNVSSMDESMFADLKKEFDNSKMCDIMERYAFQKPFDRNDPDNIVNPTLQGQVDKLYQDQRLLQDVDYFRRLYRQKQECLLHGDLHAGSVLVPLARDEDQPKMFDTEFSCVGPPAYDVGHLIAYFFMAYYQHELTEENNDLHRQVMYKILDASRKFIETYLDHRGPLSDAYTSEFHQEVAGFASCEILSNILGCVSSEKFGHSTDMGEAALNCGLRLMRQRQAITDVGRLMMIGLQLC